ncbi:hypothetical protein Taro_023992 [Colocasia esculenta]|uniref:Uncharacterized protein n=1 Tax=Colocasia esculenta TaxID=4460 RepID=A0A843V574_COLES|nr:hypothetical protein [Colocasia esculenta]
MEPEGRITYKCRRTVSSFVPVQPGRFHRLSALDLAMEPNSIRAVFYYPRFPSAASSCRAGTSFTARLRDSLSEVLGSYPVATGRLQRAAEGRGSWVVKCNDAGVRIMEARARGSVEEWLLAGKLERQREMELVFWEDVYERPYFWSTFYVQLTEFEGGGLAIGVSCSHMLADAACLTMLVKSWADMNLLGKILSPPDFHPFPPRTTAGGFTPVDPHRPLFSPPIDHYKSAAAETEDHSTASYKSQRRFNTVAFAFSEETVRSIVNDSCPAGGDAPTAFQALAALFWASISRAKGSTRGLVDISVCVDARGALGLSKSFFGNALAFNGVPGGGVEEGRLDMAAKAVADAMTHLDKPGVMGLIEWLEAAHEETSGPTKMTLCGPRLLFANWEDLGPYVATFEPGIRPIRVSYYLEPVVGEGQVLVLPLARGHAGSVGRVVMVTLPDEQLDVLCGDVLILGYEPEMLMGPNKT